MNFLEWVCENTIITIYAKSYDNKIYVCDAKAEKCKYCSTTKTRIQKEMKKNYICSKKGILEKKYILNINYI